jgi:hypothetical protein
VIAAFTAAVMLSKKIDVVLLQSSNGKKSNFFWIFCFGLPSLSSRSLLQAVNKGKVQKNSEKMTRLE